MKNSSGWSNARISELLAEVKKVRLAGEKLPVNAEKWWDKFVKTSDTNLSLWRRFAEELKIRKATIHEFYLAYV